MHRRVKTIQEGQESTIRSDAISAVRSYQSRIPDTRLTDVMRQSKLVKERKPRFKLVEKLELLAGLAANAVFVPISIATRHMNLNEITISSLLSKDTYLQAALAATGFLGVTFGEGLRKVLPESMVSKTESWAFTLSSLALTVAALRPPPSPIHYPAAAAFFVGAAVTIAAVGSNLIEHGKKAIGAFSVAASAAGAAAIAYGASKNIHVPAREEIIASISNGVWMGGMAIYALVKNKSNRN